MASGVIFEEITCKTIINKTNTPGLGFRWSINPYRGCQHACVYCFARNTHEYLGYDAGRDFESRIVVKINAAEILRQELSRAGWRGELIVLGTACDPYQQAEMKYEITRQMLRVFIEFAQPVHMLTKSTSVLRDLDLWSRLAQAPRTRRSPSACPPWTRPSGRRWNQAHRSHLSVWKRWASWCRPAYPAA